MCVCVCVWIKCKGFDDAEIIIIRRFLPPYSLLAWLILDSLIDTHTPPYGLFLVPVKWAML